VYQVWSKSLQAFQSYTRTNIHKILTHKYSNVCAKFGGNRSRRSRVMPGRTHTYTHIHTQTSIFIDIYLLYIYLFYFRTTRSKLRERNAASSPTFPGSSSVAGSSPTAGPSGARDELVSASGYNSGDEYGPCESEHLTETEWLEVICLCCLSLLLLLLLLLF
jgi:hypothetical protein